MSSSQNQSNPNPLKNDPKGDPVSTPVLEEFQTFFMNKIKNLRLSSQENPEKYLELVSKIENKKTIIKKKEDPLNQFLTANMELRDEPSSQTNNTVGAVSLSNPKFESSPRREPFDKHSSDDKPWKHKPAWKDSDKWKGRKARGWKESPEVNEDFPRRLGQNVNNYLIHNLNDDGRRNEVDLIKSDKQKRHEPADSRGNLEQNSIFEVGRSKHVASQDNERPGEGGNPPRPRAKKKLTKIRSLRESETSSHNLSRREDQAMTRLEQKTRLVKDLIEKEEKRSISIDCIEIEKVDTPEIRLSPRKKQRRALLPKATADLHKFFSGSLFKYASESEQSLRNGFSRGHAGNPFFGARIQPGGADRKSIECDRCQGLLVKGSTCVTCRKNYCCFCYFDQLDMDAIFRSEIQIEEVIDEENGFKCECGAKDIESVSRQIKDLVKSRSD